MSIQNRRRAFLGFGVLAAVLIVAVIAIWPPQIFDQDAATGAIGAVEKHREQQIAPQDVVLGDEAARQEQRVAYADYLDDATRLQNIAAELAVRSNDARSQANRAAQELESVTAEVQARYARNFDAALQAMKRDSAMVDAATRGQLESEIADLSVRAKGQLSSDQMEALSGRLRSAAEQLEKSVRDQAELGRAALGRRAVEMRNLENAENELGRAVSSLQARSCCSNEMLVEASARFDQASRELAASSRQSLSHYSEYLNAMSLERRKLDGVRANLAAAAQLENAEEMAVRVRNVSEALADEAMGLEKRALKNLQQQLEARTNVASRIRNLEDLASRANNAVGNRASMVQDQSMESFSRSVQNLSQNLEATSRDFQAGAIANVRAELAALSGQLDSRKQLEARGIDRHTAIGIRVADVNSLGSHLSALTSSLDARSAFGAMIRDRDQLEAHARDLMARAETLQGTMN